MLMRSKSMVDTHTCEDCYSLEKDSEHDIEDTKVLILSLQFFLYIFIQFLN